MSSDEFLPLAVELRHCSQLQEISLENNRLAAPVLDLRALANLRSLQLFGNPLEFLPELSPCTVLRQLSLVNVRPLNVCLLKKILEPSGPFRRN